MKLSVKKLAVCASLLAGMGGTALMAAPAGAVPAASYPGATLNEVGSDTTYWAMMGIHAAYNVDLTVNTESPKDRIIETPPVVTAPFPAGSVVPGDTNGSPDCGQQIYSASNLPPNGSSAGISALNADGSNGCIDFARSSRGQKGTDPAADQFFAYGLDALTWGKFAGTHAPTNLTQQNLIDIYTCDPSTGAPYVSNWNQVGGTAGTIKKYAPQTSSGTYSFFNSKILNGGTIDSNCDGSHLSTFTEEHDARSVSAANKPFAITPFSFAQWTSDSKQVTPDLRNGVVLGSINGVKPAATTINEVAPSGGSHFLGTRYVFNVLNTNEPRYNDTLRFAGVDNAGAGWLCSATTASGTTNRAATIIKLYGEFPLTKAPTGGGVSINSFCRLNPAAL